MAQTKFKVGDRVRIENLDGTGIQAVRRFIGKACVVTECESTHTHLPYEITDERNMTWWLGDHNLSLVEPAKDPLTEYKSLVKFTLENDRDLSREKKEALFYLLELK